MEEDKKPVRVAFYLRVSTEEQVEGFGLAMQLDGLNELVKYRSKLHNWVHEKKWEFIDEGLSGADLNRPKFKELMECVKRKEVDLVAVWKIDRLSRNLSHLLFAFEEMQKYGVSFYSLKENVDFTGPIGKLTFQIFGALAEFERETIKTRTMEGKIASARLGNYTGSAVPYGYKKVKNIDKKGSQLEVIPEEAKWVKQIFFWFILERKNYGEIAIEMNKLHVPKSNQRGSKVKDTQWYDTSIKDILKNSIYLGYREITFKDHGVVREKAPQIITKVVFDQAKEIIHEITETSGNKGGGQREYLLSRKIYNPISKRKFIGYMRPKGGHSYRHKAFIREDGLRYSNLEIPGEVIDNFVWNHVLMAINNPKKFFAIYKKQIVTKVHVRGKQREIENVVRQKEIAEKSFERLMEDYYKGSISEEFRDRKQAEYQKTINDCMKSEQALLDELERLINHEMTFKAIEGFALYFKDKVDDLSFEQRRTIISVLVERIEAYYSEEGKLKIKILFRFAKPKGEKSISVVEPKKPASNKLNTMLSTLKFLYGALDRVRTYDLWFRKPTLYPAELRVHIRFA